MKLVLRLSEDPGSDCDSDSGDHGGSRSGTDDPHRLGDRAGGPAEDPPAAGGDSSHVASDPDSSSPQPRPAKRPIVCRRVPGSAVHPAAADRQGSTSPGWHQGKNPCQAQRGEQLSSPWRLCSDGRPSSELMMRLWSRPLVDGVSSLLYCWMCKMFLKWPHC